MPRISHRFNLRTLTLFVATLSVLVCCSFCELHPTNKHLNDVVGLTTPEAIEVLGLEQPQVYRKALKHHMQKVAADLKDLGYAREKINTQIFKKFGADSKQNLFKELKDFMIETVFNKFDMHTLTSSFQTEIRSNPEVYFLTFQMYDLIMDD